MVPPSKQHPKNHHKHNDNYEASMKQHSNEAEAFNNKFFGKQGMLPLHQA